MGSKVPGGQTEESAAVSVDKVHGNSLVVWQEGGFYFCRVGGRGVLQPVPINQDFSLRMNVSCIPYGN